MLTLAEALPRLMQNELSELNLVDVISDFGAKHLRKAVMTSSSLTVLHVDGNKLSAMGMAELCRGIVGTTLSERRGGNTLNCQSTYRIPMPFDYLCLKHSQREPARSNRGMR